MKVLINIILLLSIPFLASAQAVSYRKLPTKSQADSLRLLYTHTKNDSTRMLAFIRLGFYYRERNRDSAFYFYKQALSLARQLKLKFWEASALDDDGFTNALTGNYSNALRDLLSAQTIIENKSIEKNIWHVSIVSKEDDPHFARLHELENNYHSLGVLYMQVNDIHKELSYYFQARAINYQIFHDSADLGALSVNDLAIGKAYLDLGKLDSALLFEQEALRYNLKTNYEQVRGFILYFTGSIYLQKKSYEAAKKYFLASIKENKKEQRASFLGYGYASMADLLLRTHQIDSSFFYANQAIRTLRDVNAPEQMSQVYTTLAGIYKTKSKIDSAFLYQQLAENIKDSLFNTEKINAFQNMGFGQEIRVQQLEKEKIETRGRIRTYALLSGLVVITLIAFLLYKNNRAREKNNKLLQKQKQELQTTLIELKATQAQLIQSEKMASLGELTAGIAHEIQNPLNFVNNFSEVNDELIDELKSELATGNLQSANEIADDIKENSGKINHHGKRADTIVKSMLEHSRTSKRIKEPTDINKLADEYLRLAYHGLRAKDKTFNAEIKTDFDETIGKINIVPQDIGRVLLNLFNNAFYACAERNRSAVNEQKSKNPDSYQPTVSVTTKKSGNSVTITVKDNGGGIPENIKEKIFQPFFTTKPTGSGTGLGLSLSYDIVKAHGGEFKVESNEGEGSEFVITIPVI